MSGKKPLPLLAYAKQLYCESACVGAVSTLTDSEIVDCRVRAFIDGANWGRRQERRSRRKSIGK